MKQAEVLFNFDSAKLEAINIYLREKNMSLSDELDSFMELLYKKQVPQQVRDFIEIKESDGSTETRNRKNIRRKTSPEQRAVCDVENVLGTTTPPSKDNAE